MNNKCHNGCDWGFVPVNGNWDFNMNRADCAQRSHCSQQKTVRQGDCCEYQLRNRSTGCGCEEKSACECQTRNRNTGCSCEEKSACECQTRNRSTGCGCEEKSVCTGRGNQMPAMVKINMQALGEAYHPANALKAGTLFPELHKPMQGYCPCDETCGDNCQAVAFMLWELRLYLNTHPHDQEAIALFRRLCHEGCEPNYATTFLNDEDGDGCWGWAKNPWPWEYNANGCKCVKEGVNHVCV